MAARRAAVLPALVGAVIACSAPLQQIILPAHILELSCATGSAPCGTAAASEEAAFWLEGSRSFVNVCALLTLPALTLAADRWGRKPVLCLCVCSMALDALACALAPTLALMLALHSASGLLGSVWLFLAAACASRADLTSAEGSDRSGAFALIEAAVMSALVVGPFAWGAFAQALGNRAAMLAMSCALLLLLLLMAALLPETLAPELRAARLGSARALLAAAHPLAPLGYLRGARHAGMPGAAAGGRACSGVLLVACMMAACWGAMRATEYLYVPFAATEFGWSDARLGAYSTVLSCAMVASNLLVSLTSSRAGARDARAEAHAITRSSALSAACACALWACLSALRAERARWAQPLFWVGALPYGLAMCISPVLRARLSALVPAAEQARALGCAAAVETVAAVCAPLAVGALLEACERIGLPSLGYVPSALLFLAIAPLSAQLEHTAGAWRPHALAEPLIAAVAAAEAAGHALPPADSDGGAADNVEDPRGDCLRVPASDDADVSRDEMTTAPAECTAPDS